MINEISFIVFIILTIMSAQCTQSNRCQCCQSCCCCNQNNTSSYYKEKHGVDDRDIYYYLQDNRNLTQQDINKIAENYLRIVNEANATTKTLDDVAIDILTPEIIIQYLKIDKAINEIDNINDVRGKIIKIISIVNDDFINKNYTYENSNLKLPRCLVEHENNNCVLESYFTAMLSDPYIIKLFYLFNHLFKQRLFTKENYPLTFEVCKFFNEAVNHPNFTDTIRCISIMKAYFDNYPNNWYAQIKDENGNLMYTYGSFQNTNFIDEIKKMIICEINTDQGPLPNMLLLNKIIDGIGRGRLGIRKEHDICHLHYVRKEITKLDRLNYSGYRYKDKFIHFASISFAALTFHYYTFRKINNIWINYDSYKVKTPTPVSDKFMSRLILNSISYIPNFNGNYPSYITNIINHYDLL